MKIITISSSLRFKEIIEESIKRFTKIGIEARFPNLNSGLKKEDLDLNLMKQIERTHFEAIDSSEALYVINPDGYIGTLVSVEIGYALGAGKPVYCSEKAGSLDLDALASGYISLDDIEKFLEL